MLRMFLCSAMISIMIIIVYPTNIILASLCTGMLMEDYSQDGDLIKNFGKVKINNYEKYEDLGKVNEDDYKAIYFNEEQANEIKKQIEQDKNWTRKPFTSVIDMYSKTNIEDIEDAYYYIIGFDKDFNDIDISREELDKKGCRYYNSAIFDGKNNVLYYYCEHYER